MFENYYREVLEMYKENPNVHLPEKLNNEDVSNTRRPKVLIRGKQITREQAVKIVAEEEPLFHGWDLNDLRKVSDRAWDTREGRGILKNIFYRQGFDWLDTWLHADGYIGGNILYLGKYPEADEYLPEWIDFGLTHPEADMVVSFTDIDENTCHWCPVASRSARNFDAKEDTSYEVCKLETGCKRKDWEKCIKLIDKIMKYEKYDSILDNPKSYEARYYYNYEFIHLQSSYVDRVYVTIWIHEGEVTVLDGDAAREKFKEYNGMYCCEELEALLESSMYDEKFSCICDEEFIKDCFKSAGLPEECYEIAIELGFIKRPDPEAVVMTKEYVLEQHKKLGQV